MRLVAKTESEAETRALGQRIGARLQAGDVVTLSGPLGAGKTVLAQGLAAGMGVEEPVSSPTFALIHEYRGRLPVWHVDAYRLGSAAEGYEIGLTELFGAGGVVLMEWPERVAGLLPPDRLAIELIPRLEDQRELRLTVHGCASPTVLAGIG